MSNILGIPFVYRGDLTSDSFAIVNTRRLADEVRKKYIVKTEIVSAECVGDSFVYKVRTTFHKRSDFDA